MNNLYPNLSSIKIKMIFQVPFPKNLSNFTIPCWIFTLPMNLNLFDKYMETKLSNNFIARLLIPIMVIQCLLDSLNFCLSALSRFFGFLIKIRIASISRIVQITRKELFAIDTWSDNFQSYVKT